jgi:hypothetical protein
MGPAKMFGGKSKSCSRWLVDTLLAIGFACSRPSSFKTSSESSTFEGATKCSFSAKKPKSKKRQFDHCSIYAANYHMIKMLHLVDAVQFLGAKETMSRLFTQSWESHLS